MRLLSVLLCSMIVVVLGNQLPDNFKKCKQSDPDVNQCLKTAIQDALPLVKDGLPAFNFPSIEPIEIDSMTIGEGTGAVHMVQNYKNVKLYGISSAKITAVEVQQDENEGTMTLHADLDEIRFDADYDINGQIMVMPVVGKGKCTMKLLNVASKLVIKTKQRKKKGVVYSNIEEFLVSIEPKKVESHFENLFDGDDALGNEINKLVNDNWSDIFADVKSGYEEVLGLIFKNIVSNIYNKVPYNDMFPL